MDSSVDGLCLFKHISIMEYVDVENEFGLIVSRFYTSIKWGGQLFVVNHRCKCSKHDCKQTRSFSHHRKTFIFLIYIVNLYPYWKEKSV